MSACFWQNQRLLNGGARRPPSGRFAGADSNGLLLAAYAATAKDAEKPPAHKKRTAPQNCPLVLCSLALAELRSAAGGFETVLARLVAGSHGVCLLFRYFLDPFPQ